jgi:predicted DNA-binding protein YlxM (UPF0122 family)
MKTSKKQSKKTDPMADLISQAEAARLRGVTRAAISDLIKRDKIKSVEVAGRQLVFRSEILDFEPGEPGRPPRAKAKLSSGKKR